MGRLQENMVGDLKMQQSDYKTFYAEKRAEFYGNAYTTKQAENKGEYSQLKQFIDNFDLTNKRCLEIGSSGGGFQDMVDDYYGTDISADLAKYYHKPYRVAEGTTYPFDDEMFDAIWTIHVYEHIPHIQRALLEIGRLLRPGGVLLFAPAWQCRPWAANGYAVRPYKDFDLKGKFIKASIPVRDSVVWRSIFIFPKRIWRLFQFVIGKRFDELKYKQITPNYNEFWCSDSDACNSIDPHDAILWFKSHNFECLSHPSAVRALMVRTGPLVFRKL
jgi:SAM-dependent methyltransferase